jgi:aminopeptidase N
MITQLFSAHREVRRVLRLFTALLILALGTLAIRADEPYARSRDYDLQHSRIVLRFDTEQKKVIGDVTHSLSILREGTSTVAFDSVGLTIHDVTVNKTAAKFETTDAKLIVPLPNSARAGEKFEVEIRYEGQPKKGVYFILPDKDYPDRPRQIWTQGESEDTRFYLPTYDYPNDRLTTDTIVTVPSSWVTVANGRLISVTDAGSGMKTWTWKESLPSSTYLTTVVAGEFDEVKDSWRKTPVTYYAPKGRGDRLKVNYGRTPEMMEYFSKKLGVDYPWEKYAQSMVDDFIAGGMENSSATTNTSSSLQHPALVPEYTTNQDGLISHELAHQWFGDLVTCKDWGNIWLNEGFATFFERAWIEFYYPKDQSDYERWTNARGWFANPALYAKPIVHHDFDDSSEFDGNAYNKAGWVLYMLRHQIGEDAFYRGLQHYLEVNRGKNVVTSDLVRAIDEANHISVDEFFDQWIYGAGAPRFDLSYTYDGAKHQVALTVKQTQKAEGHVGIFHVPTDIEITTASGHRLTPIHISKETETFTLPSDSAPLMVLFDKGGHILKSAEFHKEKKEWLYQLKNASEFSDRADATVALGKTKNDNEVVAALGEALNSDKAWGIRASAAEALSRIGGSASSRQLLDALNTNDKPWVRERIVSALASFKDDPTAAVKLDSIAREDHFYRVRASAIQGIGRLKPPNAFTTLTAAVSADSPDGVLRDAALSSFGPLGDDKAVSLLVQWSAVGKPIDSRTASIGSLGQLDKGNQELTRQIASYLNEPRFPIRMAAIFSLGSRGDASAIPALETLLKGSDLSIEVAPMIKGQIARLQKAKDGKANQRGNAEEGEDADNPAASEDQAGIAQRLSKLERLIQEMNERLKTIEDRLPAPKQ